MRLEERDTHALAGTIEACACRNDRSVRLQERDVRALEEECAFSREPEIAFGGSFILSCAGRAARCCVGPSGSAGHELHWMVRTPSCLIGHMYPAYLSFATWLRLVDCQSYGNVETNLFVRLCLQQGSASTHARQRVDNHILRDSLFIVQLPPKRRMHVLFDVYGA